MYTIKFRGLEFKIYLTAKKTWKAYFRYAGKPYQIHKKYEKDAIDSARDLIDKLCEHGEVKGTISKKEDEIYHEACKIAEPFGITILDAVKFYAQAHAGITSTVTVYDASQEFLKVKQADGLSYDYLRTLRKDLKQVSEAYGLRKISEITSSEIDYWLRSLNCAPRTRNNLRNTMITLWRWGVAQAFVPYGKTAPEQTSVAKEPKTDVTLLSPEQMGKILQVAQEQKAYHVITYLILGGFAGVRTAEIERLTWDNIHLEAQYISIGADKTKTATRRVVPILPNLEKWLKMLHETGAELKCKEMSRHVNPMARFCGVTWSPNLLRHSYISYRVAQTQDVAKVALEAGNSPAKIFSNYRAVSLPDKRLVTEKLAEKWFGIVP